MASWFDQKAVRFAGGDDDHEDQPADPGPEDPDGTEETPSEDASQAGGARGRSRSQPASTGAKVRYMGREYLVRRGPRGGEHIVVKGEKVYTAALSRGKGSGGRAVSPRRATPGRPRRRGSAHGAA